MNLREEKGITGIDITVTVIVITLFVALIATLLTAINTSSSSIDRKTEATNHVISTIEELKAESWDNIQKIEDGQNNGYNGYINNTSYYRTIEIKDYAKIKEEEGFNKEDFKEGLVKKLTVQVSYKNGKDDEVISISTVLTKGD